MTDLKIEGLTVEIEGKPILKGLDLEVNKGEIHALMGPNGAGKSTLGYAISGHPSYEITEGSVELGGEDITEMDPNERAQLGLFLAMQYPTEIPGVSLTNFLRTAMNAVRGTDVPVREFMTQLRQEMGELGMVDTFL